MQVEIWSDVVCPWCAVGKRHFEHALEDFAHADEVQVRWRSFELDPTAPRVFPGDHAGRLAAKYGTTREAALARMQQSTDAAGAVGWKFRLDRSQGGNSFDAHRLLHLAADQGIQDAVKERFLSGYLEEGEAIGEQDTLQRLAKEAGLDVVETERVLTTDAYAQDVRNDEREAHQLGISGVPFFVIDRRFGVSGAQPAANLLQALEQAWQERSPLTVIGAAAGSGHDHAAGECVDGSCAI